MDLYGILGTAGQGVLFGIRGALRGPVREPWLVILATKLLALIALGHFYLPQLVGFLEPWVRWTGGDAAPHYPDLFWRLPEILRTTDALLGGTIFMVAWAVAVLRFAGSPEGWGRAFRLSPALVALGILGPGLAWAITTLFNMIPLEIRLHSFVVRMGLQGIELGLIALLYAALGYALAAIALEGASIGRALSVSFRLFGMQPLVTLLLVAVPLAAVFPPTFFLHEMNIATSGLRPEVIGLVLALLLVLKSVLALLLVGALTFVYLRFREAIG